MTSTHHPDRVVLPDAPGIPGLTFRHPRDAADWVGQAELVRAVSVADDDDYAPTPDSLRIDIEHQPNLDPARDLLLAEVDGTIVAHAFRNAAIRTGYAVHYVFGRVHPDWRRRGIGRAMLHWNEARARAFAAEHEQDGFDGPGAQLGSWVGDTEPEARSLLESEGYRITRYGFTMIHGSLDSVEPVAMPEGLEIRPVTADHRRAIFEADDEAFHDHFEHRPQTDEDFEAQIAQPDLDTSLWRVAWDGDEVAASVQAWIWKDENEALGVQRGWLERISVRRPWRRRGLARALIASALIELRERGMTEALLGVDAENPNGALALYESIGFGVKSRGLSYRKPLRP